MLYSSPLFNLFRSFQAIPFIAYLVRHIDFFPSLPLKTSRRTPPLHLSVFSWCSLNSPPCLEPINLFCIDILAFDSLSVSTFSLSSGQKVEEAVVGTPYSGFYFVRFFLELTNTSLSTPLQLLGEEDVSQTSQKGG